MQTVNTDLLELALAKVTGEDFERFVNAFLPALDGLEYVPLGGVHDGGADAFFDSRLYEGGTGSRYYQVSIQTNHLTKIRHTIKRLFESGRTPKRLVYVTNKPIRSLDQDQEKLWDETDVHVSIRDANWIVANINHSQQTIAAYQSYLRPYLSYLDNIGNPDLIGQPKHLESRAVCVFLRQEVQRHQGNTRMVSLVSDALILWALRDTDPDTGIFATRDEVVQRIISVLPTSKHFIEDVIDERLMELYSKGNRAGRKIRYYSKEEHYCLPYSTRELVRKENVEDETMKLNVLRVLERRASQFPVPSPREVAKIALRAIELSFEEKGFELAMFLENNHDANYQSPSIADQVDHAIEEGTIDSTLATRDAAIEALRGAFYHSEEAERRYFTKLSRTYALLFALGVEPRIVEYFQAMSANLTLLVGTDILIRALSERYLRTEDQITCNLLDMLHSAGAELMLAEPVVEEVFTHLCATDREFDGDFRRTESYVTEAIAAHSPRILIRAYFYAKLVPSEGVMPPSSWMSYIGQFCDYSALHTPNGLEQIGKYLQGRFGLEFVSNEQLDKYSDQKEVSRLADDLEEIRRSRARVLSDNDARMVLGVYGRRKEHEERVSIIRIATRRGGLLTKAVFKRLLRILSSNKAHDTSCDRSSW